MTDVSDHPAINFGTLGFGEYTALPALPNGWSWSQRRNDWLYVRDEFGRTFYVHFLADATTRFELRRQAGIWDWIRTRGRLKPGMFYSDGRYSFLLSKRGNIRQLS